MVELDERGEHDQVGTSIGDLVLTKVAAIVQQPAVALELVLCVGVGAYVGGDVSAAASERESAH